MIILSFWAKNVQVSFKAQFEFAPCFDAVRILKVTFLVVVYYFLVTRLYKQFISEPEF